MTKLSAKGAVLGTYKAGDGPFGIAFDGTSIWVTNFWSGSVMKLNPADGTVLGTFKAGDGAAGVTVNQGRVLIVNNGSNSIITLSTEGAQLSKAIVGRSPFAVVSDGTYAWVTNSGSNSISKR